MSPIEEGAKLGGWFGLNDERQVLGDLTIAGQNTSLYLHDADIIHFNNNDECNLTGVLHDKTKVTLVDCHVRSMLGSAQRNEESYYFAEVEPLFVLSGDRLLDLRKPTVNRVIFHIDDAESVFYDFDAFGCVIEPEPLISDVVASNATRIDSVIPTGPHPEILYFTGRTEIASVATRIGKFKVFHRPAVSRFGSPKSVGIQDRVLTELTFGRAVFLSEAIARVTTVLRFLEILAGRPQNIDWIQIGTSGAKKHSLLDLYWTLPPKRPADWEVKAPHPAELPIDAIRERQEFENILKSWIGNDANRSEARHRFSDGFKSQNSFSIDRLVGAANMFDLLPSAALPPKPPIAAEVVDAKRRARYMFRQLPESDERRGFLSALGRIGSLTLKRKIRHRAAIVSNALRKPLAHLDVVTDEAVKCRNRFVHGTPGTFNYAENGGVIAFLTQALEFIFVASDLLDSGWDIQRWEAKGSMLAHPLSQVLCTWDLEAKRIIDLRQAARTESQ